MATTKSEAKLPIRASQIRQRAVPCTGESVTDFATEECFPRNQERALEKPTSDSDIRPGVRFRVPLQRASPESSRCASLLSTQSNNIYHKVERGNLSPESEQGDSVEDAGNLVNTLHRAADTGMSKSHTGEDPRRPSVTGNVVTGSESPGPKPIIKKTSSQYNPSVVAGETDVQRVRKIVRIGSQEISSTVTYYVPYESDSANMSNSMVWPTLKEDAFQERFPNLAALSKASISDALKVVGAAEVNEEEDRFVGQESKTGAPDDETSAASDDVVPGLCSTTPDFMDVTNLESLRLPLLQTGDVSKRFPQLAQLDQPAFCDAN